MFLTLFCIKHVLHSFSRHDPISTNPCIIKDIHALLIQGFSKFCCTPLYFHSSIEIILMGKRELVALLSLSTWYLVMVVWLFLTVPWVFLWFVIVVFPDHTHLLVFVILNILVPGH